MVFAKKLVYLAAAGATCVKALKGSAELSAYVDPNIGFEIPKEKPLCNFMPTNDMLVVGGSIAASQAPGGQSWVDLLQEDLGLEKREHGVIISNSAKKMTGVDYWVKMAQETGPSTLTKLGLIMVSVPIDDNVAQLTDEAEIQKAVDAYVNKIRMITGLLRTKMCFQAKLILTSPFPDNRYTPIHMKIIEAANENMAAWQHLTWFVNFFDPIVADESGHWLAGTGEDAKPYAKGHENMFSLIRNNYTTMKGMFDEWIE